MAKIDQLEADFRAAFDALNRVKESLEKANAYTYNDGSAKAHLDYAIGSLSSAAIWSPANLNLYAPRDVLADASEAEGTS